MNDASHPMDSATFNDSLKDARGFTVVQSLRPERVGKRFYIDVNGKLAKDRPVASIWRGRATTVAATVANFVKALRKTTESSDTVLVLDSFRGAAPGAPAVIEVVTDEELGRLTDGADAASPNQGYFETEDAFWSARLKDSMQPSGYLLFDADNAPGMPEAWKKLTLAERLKEMDRPGLLPGVSKCRRVQYLGSSARVVKQGDTATPAPTHALVQVSNPELIDALRAHVRVTTVLMGLSFKSPRHSRDEPDKIIGYSDLTLFDLVVWVGGRLVFNPRPDVSAAAGYRVLDANVQIANPDGGPLDISWVKPPDVKTRKAFREKTGVKYKVDLTRSSGFVFEERSQLQFMTEVEIQGVVKPLADWLTHMFKNDIGKMRCETPFRASESEAGFLRITEHGDVFLYDAGTETAHYAPRFPWSDAEVSDMSSEIEEFQTLSAMVDARHAQRLREAQAAFSILSEEEIEAAKEQYRVDTLEEVKAAARALQAGDVEGAKATLERLARLHGRTAVDDDFVLDLVKKALGKPATTTSLRLLLKDVDARRRQRNGDDDDWFDPDGGDGGGDDDDDDGGGDDEDDEDDEDEEDNDAHDWVTRMNRRYAIIRDRPDAVFDTRGTGRELLKPLKVAAFHLLHANKTITIEVDGKIRRVARSKLWLINPQRREYTTVDDYPIGMEPRGALNLWKGLAVTPRPGKWPTIEEFLRDVICAGALPDYAYLIDLLNWKIQNPTENPEVAISLQGLQGFGKGTLGLFLQTIFGLKRYQLFGRPDDISNRFNAEAEGKLILFYDEAVFAHDPKVRGKLKSEITEPWFPIEPKGIDRYYVRNRALRIFASNDAAPIAVDLDDRRALVLEVADIHANDIAYFKALRQAFDGEEMAAFVNDALAADLTVFETTRRNPPKTKAKADLADKTARPEQEFLRALLERGKPPGDGAYHWGPLRYPRMNPEPKDPWRDGRVTVERDAPHNSYLAWLKRAKPQARPVNDAELHRIIQQILGVAAFRSEKVRVGKESLRMIVIAGLDKCRAAFDKHTGYKRDWD